MFDKDQTRCRGVCRYAVRCKRHGQPVDGEFWCYQHAEQGAGTLGRMFRALDEEQDREWWGVYE